MRRWKDLKRDTRTIIIAVIILTLVTLSVSYSAFFTVQSLPTIQEISTGNLDVAVTIDNTNSIMSQNEQIYPSNSTEVENGTNGYYSLLTLTNNGSIDATFSVTVSYDLDKLRQVSGFGSLTDTQLMTHLVSFNYLRVGIYEETSGQTGWVDYDKSSSTVVKYPLISNLTPSSSDSNAYPILKDVVKARITGNDTIKYQRQFRIYVWLDEQTPASEIGKYVYLKIKVKSAAGNETITDSAEV